MTQVHSSVVPSRGLAVDPHLREPAAGDLPDRAAARQALEGQRPGTLRVDLRQLLELAQLLRDPRLLGAAADDVEAHHRARRRLPDRVVQDHLRADAELAEVDDHVHALGRLHRDRAPHHRRRQQAAVGADLDHLAPVAQLELERPRVGGVEEAEAVQAPLDLHPRRDRAVDQDRVAAEAAVEVGPVAEGAVDVERAVRDHQRDVVVALGQVELLVVRVVEDVERGQAGEQRLRRLAVRVVVVPERRRVLDVRVLVQPLLAVRDRVVRMAVELRLGHAPVQVHVQRAPGIVDLADLDRLPALGADRRPREQPVVAEHRGLEVGQDLGLARLHREGVLLRALGAGADRPRERRDRQVALERLERARSRLARERGRLLAVLARHRVEVKRAHEGDAPEATRECSAAGDPVTFPIHHARPLPLRLIVRVAVVVPIGPASSSVAVALTDPG